MEIIRNLSESPGLCVALSLFFFLLAYSAAFFLLDALLRMHRSRSAVKKIKKQYRFLQRLWLRPYEEHCLHAPAFCRFLVRFQRTGAIVFCAYLLAGCFIPDRMTVGWLTAGRFLAFDAPILILNTLLSRPIIGRFRMYAFEKYHNTQNHTQLF